MLRFGQRMELMPFVLITSASGYLMTTDSQGVGFISDPGDSRAVHCVRLSVLLPSFNEASHPRMDIACSCSACESDWITAHSQNSWRRVCVWEGRKSAACIHIPKRELA